MKHVLWFVVVVCMVACEEPLSDAPLEVNDANEQPWTTAATADGTWTISWRPRGGPIVSAEPIVLEIKIDQGERSVGLVVDAEMPHHGHGMNFVPEVTGGDGAWVATGLLFHMPGRWEVAIDVVHNGVTERAQWTVEVE